MRSALSLRLVFSLVVCGLSACTSSPSSYTGDESEGPERKEQQIGSQPPSNVAEKETRASDEERGPKTSAELRVSDQQLADTTRIACERVRAKNSLFGDPERVSLDELTSEGGFAEVFRRDGDVVRVYGALLTGSSRFRFDYIFGDGELLCARETLSNVHVIMEREIEGWEHYWHHQHLVFAEGEVVSEAAEYTAGAADRGQEIDRLREFADSVLAVVARP